jgi:hypothetical protein
VGIHSLFMSFLASVKRFFGLEKTAVSAPQQKTLEQLYQDRLAAVAPGERPAFLTSEQKRAEEESTALLARARGQAGDADHFFALAREHFAFEVFLHTQGMPAGGSAVVNPELEKVLGRLLAYAEVFAKPSPELITFLDQYIQEFEEPIFLAEARGEYTLSVSEHGKWIRFPFLAKDKKILRRQDAQKKLGPVFAECPELALLEMDTHVPWQPVSFLEFSEKAKSGRMVLLREPKSEKYYAYLYA